MHPLDARPRPLHRRVCRAAARRSTVAILAAPLALAACHPAAPPAPARLAPAASAGIGRLPTGAHLDPAGRSTPLGSMPLAMVLSPDGRRVVVLLDGWREQGVQVADRATGRVLQTLDEPSVFLGAAFSPGGHSLYVSGGDSDLIYRYAWQGDSAARADSIVLAPRPPQARHGTHYPAGLALSPDGRTLYVAEDLADSLAVVDLATKRVVQRFPTEHYPYGVAVAPNGAVYVSAWGGYTVSTFAPAGGGRLRDTGRLRVGRHPSALALSRDGARLFVASGSTDRIAVVDTRRRQLITELRDPPPAGPAEGSTPNALALSPDGTRLYVAEADDNALAVFALSAATSHIPAAADSDRLAGRVPVEWYPAAVVASGDTVLVANAKGAGTGPNPDGPTPAKPSREVPRSYTLGQLSGTLTTLTGAPWPASALASFSARVAHANRWGRHEASAPHYPPFRHVIYIIKENRTYDEVLGDLPEGDGDSALVFFPRAVSPNHHALAERFGDYDRFFVNAEVSPDGHNWSTAAYATDYLEKTVPSNYSGRGRSYDYEGTNRGWHHIPNDDVAAPANGYLWDLAQRAGITFRNYGEFVVDDTLKRAPDLPPEYRGDKPFLATHTDSAYPGFDLEIPDQHRADIWLADLAHFTRTGDMPALELVRLPNDHTSGMRPGAPSPRAAMADNDLALGRMIAALSRSPFWKSTVVFVLEDDAQNGPDHVDSHRSVLFVISPYSRPRVVHRFVNTTDVVATIADILHLGSLSQFDYDGRPLRGVFDSSPDLRPYRALTPALDLHEVNPAHGPGARASARLDFRFEDEVNEDVFNRILWRGIKGAHVPYPGPTRMSALEARRSR